jgi:AraC-like DNA-binding protein
MTDAGIAVRELRSQWYTLHDLDRAQAIKTIHQSGIRLKELAALLNCSSSLLTRLLQAGQAPPEDRLLARQGVMSTRALARQASAVGIRRTALHREEMAYEKTREALVKSQVIEKCFEERGAARDR